MLRRTCAPLKSNDDCPSMNSSPTFEQMIHCCRSLRSCPSLSSLVPYAGAVSSKFTPSSRDRLSRLRTWVSSGSSKPAGYLTPSLRPILTVPRPMQETSIPVLPSLRCGNGLFMKDVLPSAVRRPRVIENVWPVPGHPRRQLAPGPGGPVPGIRCHPDPATASAWSARLPADCHWHADKPYPDVAG